MSQLQNTFSSKRASTIRLLVARMVLSHWLLVPGMMHDAVTPAPSSRYDAFTPAPSSRYDAFTPAPSSRYDAGSSEQVFCTWLIRE